MRAQVSTQRVAYMDKSVEGFTLVETMMVLILAGIILAIGVPSFLNLIEKMSTESEAKVLVEGLRTARLLAIEERQNVVVCPSADGSTCGNDWNKGFLVYRDDNNNHTLNSGEEIYFAHLFKDSVQVKTGSGQNQRFFYNENGWAAGSAESLLVCARTGTNQNSFRVVVNRAGRIRVEDWHATWPAGMAC